MPAMGEDMSARTMQLSDDVRDYLLKATGRESDALRAIRDATSSMRGAVMLTSPEQAQFLGLLIELVSARRALEVGVFTGYSAAAVAEALPPDGKLVACELSEEYASIARTHLEAHGLADKVDILVGPAGATLGALIGADEAGTFDFAYVDADKENYDLYFERCLELVRPGGLIAIDNVLWGGSVADPDDQRDTTRAIRALNEKIGRDTRVTVSLVTIGDGLLLCRKR